MVSAMYEDDKLFSALYTCKKMLNLMRNFTVNQCKFMSTGVMWSTCDVEHL